MQFSSLCHFILNPGINREYFRDLKLKKEGTNAAEILGMTDKSKRPKWDRNYNKNVIRFCEECDLLVPNPGDHNDHHCKECDICIIRSNHWDYVGVCYGSYTENMCGGSCLGFVVFIFFYWWLFSWNDMNHC